MTTALLHGWQKAGTGREVKQGVVWAPAPVSIAAIIETGDRGASPSQAYKVKPLNLQLLLVMCLAFRYVPLRCDPHFSAYSSKENFRCYGS